jgi:hypothetical protein
LFGSSELTEEFSDRNGNRACSLSLYEKDWLFVVKKIGGSFQYEAKFGTDIETAELESTFEWVAKAGIN